MSLGKFIAQNEIPQTINTVLQNGVLTVLSDTAEVHLHAINHQKRFDFVFK